MKDALEQSGTPESGWGPSQDTKQHFCRNLRFQLAMLVFPEPLLCASSGVSLGDPNSSESPYPPLKAQTSLFLLHQDQVSNCTSPQQISCHPHSLLLLPCMSPPTGPTQNKATPTQAWHTESASPLVSLLLVSPPSSAQQRSS